MQTHETISVVLAIVSFVTIALVGFRTNILREPVNPSVPNSRPPYSFSRLQLFIWTLIIAPAFALHWGFVSEITFNETALVLLGISASVMVTASVISGSQQSAANSAAAAAAPTAAPASVTPAPVINATADTTTTDAITDPTVPPPTAPVTALKAHQPSQSFFVDILMDDQGQISIVRLQQLIFTFIYATVYIVTFFPSMAYPVFDTNAYILMGISTGSYLLGKSLNK